MAFVLVAVLTAVVAGLAPAPPWSAILAAMQVDGGERAGRAAETQAAGEDVYEQQHMRSSARSTSIGSVYHVDDFPASGGIYRGKWSAGASYNRFDTVTYSGEDWIAIAQSSAVEPHAYATGTPAAWVRFDRSGKGGAATQADCAFFWAYAFVQSHARSFDIRTGADLVFGNRTSGYDKRGDWVLPANDFGYTLSMHGQGRSNTTVNQAASTLDYMVVQEPLGSAKINSQEITGITFNANLLAGGCLNLHGVRRSSYREITCYNPQQQPGGKIQYAMWIGYQGDSYEIDFDSSLVRSQQYGGAHPAFATATANDRGEIESYSIRDAGAKLDSAIKAGPGLVTYWIGKGSNGRSSQPCAVMPDQPTYRLDPANGALRAIIPGANKGSGCGGTIYVRVHWAGTIPYGWFFGATDSTFKDIVTSGDFQTACQFDVHGSNHFIHEHPYCWAPVQIRADGRNFHEAVEMDSPIQYGLELDGPGDIISSYQTEWNNSNYYGAGDILIGTGATFNTIGPSNCGAAGGQVAGGYAKFTQVNGGPVTSPAASLPAGLVIEGAQPNCDGSNTSWSTTKPPEAASDGASAVSVSLIDDWISGGTSNGTIGALGWTYGAIGAPPSVGYAASSQTHPGVLQLETAGAAGQGYYLALGSVYAPPFSLAQTSGWKAAWVNTLLSYSDISFRMGFFSAAPVSAIPAEGIYFRFDTRLNDKEIMACVNAAQRESCAPTGLSPSNQVWHTYRISSETPGAVVFQVDALPVITACAGGCRIHATIPEKAMLPGAVAVTQAGSKKQAWFDLFRYSQQGIAR